MSLFHNRQSMKEELNSLEEHSPNGE